MKNFIAFVIHNMIIWFSVFLFSVAFFYYYKAEQIRASLHVTNAAAFNNGDYVILTKVIDGDEVQVKNMKNGKKSLVRLAGIKSFNPSASDPLVSQFGKICFSYIEQKFKNKQAVLRLEGKKVDKRNRLLGYLLFKNSKGRYERDLAKELIQNGLSVVYTKYAFKKEIEYLNAEFKARQSKVGLWGNKKAAARAKVFKEIWLKERKK